MAKGNNEPPRTFQKNQVDKNVTFKQPSRFSGGGFQPQVAGKSQYKPMPVRITQHKG